jgi:hypothetical protein
MFDKVYVKYDKSLHHYWDGGVAHRIIIIFLKIKIVVVWGTKPIRIPKIWLQLYGIGLKK